MTLKKHLERAGFTQHQGILYQDGFQRNQNFEKHYIDLREKEKRVYTDSLVRNLPSIPGDHPLRAEWMVRKSSCKKIVNHLQLKEGSKKILEAGCGNGWLSYQLATLSQSQVIGIDVNETELLQAARVFNQKENLAFAYADIFSASFPFRFNRIVFASVIQYFPDLPALVRRALELLTDDGEIHIIDSPFYTKGQLHSAKERSKNYFARRGSAMAQFYFHHNEKDLQEFNVHVLSDPATVISRLRRFFLPESPFPWIVITR